MVNGVVGMRKIQMAIIAIMATVAASWAEAAVMTPAVGRLPGNFSCTSHRHCLKRLVTSHRLRREESPGSDTGNAKSLLITLWKSKNSRIIVKGSAPFLLQSTSGLRLGKMPTFRHS